MSASPILTQGLGSFGAATLIPTLGFQGSGGAAEPLLHSGLQYSAEDSRPHWEAEDVRGHWVADDARGHYTSGDERGHYGSEDNRGHWSV